jgi:phage terminase large subunit
MSEIHVPNIQRSYNKPIQMQPQDMIKLWRHRPSIFIKDAFDVTLDAWQEDCVELYNNNQRIGVVANKGPGKTFVQALLTLHFLATRFQPKIACLSITKDHLRDNLWAELLKWRAVSSLLKESTNEGAEKITLKGHEGYSFISARSFPKQADESQMASALAGLHADNIMFAIDEAGMIPDSIFATADNALSGGDSPTKSAKMLVMANPEQPKGVLYRAYMGRSKQKWAVMNITGDPDDPKRTPRVDVDWAREQIDTYGRDNPWVQVNVFGKYPSVSSELLITEEEIHASMHREIDEKLVRNSQHRLGVDVARGGIDNTVFARRRGLKAYPMESISSDIRGPELAGKIAFMQQDVAIERVFVDNTGGYGSSVIDSLEMFPNLDVTPVVYNAKAQDKRYFNRRTEMWVRMRDWVRKGGCLPNDPGLAEELLMPKVIFHGTHFRLEEKEQIKSRLGRSPDKADALAQTFMDVESQSFFADFSEGNGEFEGMEDYEKLELMKRLRSGSNYISTESGVDIGYRSSPNYRS